MTITSDSSTAFSLLLAGSTIAGLIGLTSNLTSTNKVITLENFDMLPVKSLQIRLPQLVRTYESGDYTSTNDFVMLVSLSQYSYNDMMENNNPSVELETLSSTINNITVSIVDSNGYTPYFSPNSPLEFVFRVIFWD